MAANSANSKIRLLFHFNDHATAQEAEEVGQTLKEFKPHVVCIEHAGASEQYAQMAETTFTTHEPIFLEPDEYFEALHPIVKKSGAKVFIPERFSEEESAEIQWTHKLVHQLQWDAINQFLAGKPAAALRSYREHLETQAANETKRDTHLKRVISNLHGEIITRFPELAHEPEIRVAFVYGVGHSPLFLHAKHSGFASVDRKMPKLPYRFSPCNTCTQSCVWKVA